jgi:hypothetical protein
MTRDRQKFAETSERILDIGAGYPFWKLISGGRILLDTDHPDSLPGGKFVHCISVFVLGKIH